MIIPATKTKFHTWLFQSILKKLLSLPAPPMVQTVLKVVDNPKLFPKKSIENIVKEIKGPATYQGQGSLKNSNIK